MVNLPWAKKEYEAERGGASWAQKEREAEGARRGGLGFSNGDEKTAERNEAAADLRGAEDNATTGADDEFGASREGGLYNVASSEERADGLFTGAGRDKKDKKGKKKKGFLKRKGPMGLILALVLGAGGMMGGIQSMLPFALEEMIIEKFNSIGISSTMASDAWLNTQLNYGVRMENLKTGETENLFAFSSFQVKQLESYGIKVIDNIGGTTTGNIMALLYEKNGQYIPVVGSDILKYNGYSEQDLIEAIRNASGFSNIGKPISASEALRDADFKTPYTAASKTWRGGSSGWFDNIMSDITETKLSVNRNRWARYAAGAIKDANQKLSAFTETASQNKAIDGTIDEGVQSDGVYYVHCFDGECDQYPGSMVHEKEGKYYATQTDEDGHVVGEVEVTLDLENFGDDELGGIRGWAHNVSESESFNKIKSILNSKALKVGTKVATYGCAIIEGMATIYTVAGAYQSLQYLNLVTGFLEAVDKVKAGNGSESPMNEYAENLTRVGDTVDSNSGDEKRVVAQKTAMQSAGIINLFSGGAVSNSDVSVQNVNFESLMANLSVLTSNVQLMEETYEACGYAKLAVAGISLATTIVSLIPIIGGIVKVAEIGTKEVIKGAVTTLVGLAFQILIPIAARKIASLLIKNVATEWFGEDLGNALVSGASQYLGGNGRSGGQSGASMKKLAVYLDKQNEVIADEARYQRSIRSPFDISSKYTFLGSLTYAMLPFMYSGGGTMSTLKNVVSLTSSSLVAMLPTANAVGIQNELSSVGDCPLLESTGAVGDAFCNPYVVTDTSTMNIAPEEVSAIVHNLGSDSTIAAAGGVSKISGDNFNEDGTIKDNSGLAKYSIFCGQRTSPLGLKDATIADQVTGRDKTIVKIIGFIPVLNDIADLATGSAEIANMAWTTGESCVASEENSDWENEYKYYQRYMENERLLENMNPEYESPVTELGRRYYKENPVDDSLEGQLARFSGLPKEEVEDTLALIDYYNYIAQYDASERYAFGAPVVEMDSNIMFESEDVMAGEYILMNNIVYADIRNRVTLV